MTYQERFEQMGYRLLNPTAAQEHWQKEQYGCRITIKASLTYLKPTPDVARIDEFVVDIITDKHDAETAVADAFATCALVKPTTLKNISYKFY